MISKQRLLKCSLNANLLIKSRFMSGIGLFGICEDRNSSFQNGPKEAPPLIREQFYCDSSNTSSELSIDVAKYIKDFGDYHPSIPDMKEVSKTVSCFLSAIHAEGRFPLILGGDHSVTSSILGELRKLVGEPIVVVHFDAHPDIYPLFLDNPSSHASPFARILEQSGVCRKLISLGIRTATLEQRQQWKKYEVVGVEARHFPAHGSGIRPMLEKYISSSTPVYISFDLDALEPGLAPGVSHIESGGLSVRQVIDAIHHMPGKIIGADIVEYNPRNDVNKITAAVASKLVKEIGAKMLLSNHIVQLPEGVEI